MHEKLLYKCILCVCLFLENMSFIFTDIGMTSGLFQDSFQKSESCISMEIMMIESLEFWFHHFIVQASQFELQYKINGYKISSTIVLNVFTSFGTIQNVFEWVKETVEAVI